MQTDVFSLSNDNTFLIYNRGSTYSNLKSLTIKNDEQKITSLTEGTHLTWSPIISPDGKKIAFSMGDFEEANIFIMPVEGGEKKQLTFFDSFISSPAWSPDGNKIAFACNEDGLKAFSSAERT